jgi:hypothetical protein
VGGAPIDFGALSVGNLPLNINNFVMDQSDSATEGVSLIYADVAGYCPIA